MQIQVKSAKVWLASMAIDLRKGPNSLCELVASHFNQKIDDAIFIFYNNARNKLKVVGYHRNGVAMIYKYLDKKKFTIQRNNAGLYEITQSQLAWLLAGLDWVEMSGFKEVRYEDYF